MTYENWKQLQSITSKVGCAILQGINEQTIQDIRNERVEYCRKLAIQSGDCGLSDICICYKQEV